MGKGNGEQRLGMGTGIVVENGEFGMENGLWGMGSEECGVGSKKRGMGRGEC